MFPFLSKKNRILMRDAVGEKRKKGSYSKRIIAI
jgi:hypothetical protein